MSPLLFTLLFLLVVEASAWARLGETPEQMQARLGPPSPYPREDHVLANGKAYPLGQILNYGKEGWSVECVMINGTCAKITYVKTTPGATLTDDDINTILKNEAQGSQWTQAVNSTTIIDSIILPTFKVRLWKRADGATAQTVATGFTLISPEYQKAVDAANALAKADADKKIPNL
jgi:hypothetical protein